MTGRPSRQWTRSTPRRRTARNGARASPRSSPDARSWSPTGNFKVRANDTDYRFRAGTDFFYLTGCDEPDAVLVIAPGDDGPRSTLYIARPS